MYCFKTALGAPSRKLVRVDAASLAPERAEGIHVEAARDDADDHFGQPVAVQIPVGEVRDVALGGPALPNPDERAVLPPEPVDPAPVQQRRLYPGQDAPGLLDSRKD